MWGFVWGGIQAASPLVFWWLDTATVYALGLVLIASVYPSRTGSTRALEPSCVSCGDQSQVCTPQGASLVVDTLVAGTSSTFA
jgi:hypothetical protein